MIMDLIPQLSGMPKMQIPDPTSLHMENGALIFTYHHFETPTREKIGNCVKKLIFQDKHFQALKNISSIG